ncbi:hypothetical protein Pla163_14720 [Planctomycetes bacterium Pla163]|uniref:Uncharacterized protein n=1 Tax=Rohdeia mirabilis TaxID=2528008 RepID=A0A518CYV0_9BACT|nr:hypothetical protein Pla163_14720 [Planctomycetes bacterium Pla163]
MTEPSSDAASALAALPAELAEGVRRLRARCYRAAFLGRTTRLAAGALVVAGCTALAARVGLGIEGASALVGWAALLVVPPLAHLAARRRVPSVATAAVWLDARGSGDGALVTALELGAGGRAWEARALARARTAPAAPQIERATYWSTWPAALVFALVCPLVPVVRANANGGPRGVEALLDAAVERVAEDLAALEEELVLDDEVRAELRDRLERLQRDVADAGLEAGFEGVDALERELERLAAESVEQAADVQRLLHEAAASSSSNGSQSAQRLADALEESSNGSLARALPPELMERLTALAERARQMDADGSKMASLEDLDEWLEWTEEWAALEEEVRASLTESLERLADAGLLDQGDLDELRESLERSSAEALDELARDLAERLEALDLDEEQAAALREELADLPARPELSTELQEALARMQAQLDEEFGAVETPAGPDVSRLLENIDPDLRNELLEAMAQLEQRRAEAFEKLVELEPSAFELSPDQLAALTKALEALKDQLAAWIEEQLAAESDAARRALAQALSDEASERRAGLDDSTREALERALEDFGSDPATLARALTKIPPQLRQEILESLMQEFERSAQARATEQDGGAPAPPDAVGSNLDDEQLASLVDTLGELVRGQQLPEPPPLSAEDVQRAIQAMKSMEPGRPGAGVP